MQALLSSQEAEASLGLKHKYLFLAPKDAPLYFLVHGRAGTLDVMWTFRRCIPDGSNIISMQAPLPDQAGGYSWWDIGKKPSLAELENIPDKYVFPFLDRTLSYYNLAPRATLAFGFSQGAGLLSMAIQKAPQRFNAVALLAGFVIELALPIAPPLPPIFMAHGNKDEAVPIAKARRGQEFLLSKGFRVDFVEDPVGHKVGTHGMRALKRFVEEVSQPDN